MIMTKLYIKLLFLPINIKMFFSGISEVKDKSGFIR